MEIINSMLKPFLDWYSKNPLLIGFIEGIVSTLVIQKLLRKYIFHISVFVYRLIDLSKKRNEQIVNADELTKQVNDLKKQVNELTEES
ncbi:MAG: hypothetical protein ACK481_04845 [Candidatus Melainabacteria bacterium]|jgi:hypothetical protein